ncbi:MAG: SpoIIE family protein phosphatase [Bacteroidota bacterium]
MNKYFYIIILLIIPSFLYGQINENGLPFIKNYPAEAYGAHDQNWGIVKDNRGVMYFANNHGLLEYNGAKWTLYDTVTVQSLAKDKLGTLYIGAFQQFGMMLPDSLGSLNFFNLYSIYNPGDADFNAIRGVHTIGDRVVFRSAEKIFSYKLPLDITNLEKIKSEIIVYEPESSFHISFDIYNKFYVREKGKGLMVLKNNNLELIPGGERFANNKIYVMLPFDGEQILIVTREDGFFLFNPEDEEPSIEAFKNEASDLVQASYSYGGVALSNGRFAISTLANGIIIFNKEGKVLEHLNENSGLPDQMVLSIYVDESNEGNLWFTTNQNGIFNANINSPFRMWNKINGLEGVVADIIRFNNTIYAATSLGVYYSEQTSDGFLQFNPITDLNFESWTFQKFIPVTGDDSRLLVGTNTGVFEIMGNSAKILKPGGYVLKLYQSPSTPEKLYVGYSDGVGAYQYNEKKNKWKFLGRNDSINNTISSIYEGNGGEVYLGTAVSGVILADHLFSPKITMIDTTQGLKLFGTGNDVYNIDEDIVFATGKGLFVYDKQYNKVLPYIKFGEEFSNKDLGVYNLSKDNSTFWLGLYSNSKKKSKWEGVIKLTETESGQFEQEKAFSEILPNKIPHVIYHEDNYTWIANDKGLYKFDKDQVKDYNAVFNALINSVRTKNDSVLFNGIFKHDSDSGILVSLTQNNELIPVLEFKNNEITFEYSSTFYEFEEKSLYSYRLIGYNEKWSKWTTETKFPYTNLYEGDYVFEVKAKNIYGTESNVAAFEFTILAPWYRTIWAIISYVILAIVFIWFIVKVNTRRLKKDKERLEQIVAERTKEIRMQNVELEQQKNEITEQHDQIADQQKHIMASIQYASRIQEAVLPPNELLDDLLNEHFVLFRPRDIVSGDFYWATRKDNKAIIVAADCTGHGVPGAFMSMLGVSFLNEIVNKLDTVHANLILNELRDSIKNSLRQTGKDNEAKDGMDLALCIIDYDNLQLEYSGAFNSLYLIRDNELIKYDADRMPIGIYIKEKESFTNHIVDLKKGDNFYIFSDGYVDQFGGERGSKIMAKRFRNILLENHQKPVYEQKAVLEKFIDEWQAHIDGNGETYKQIDDILVIGMRV